MAQGKDKLSEAEWQKMVDEHVAVLNKRKGSIIVPPPGHVLIDSEYQQSLNHRFVTEDLIRHFAYAVGDPNPLWRDPSYARGTRWGGIIAPPVFDCCIASSDGAGNGPMGSFLLPGFNLFAAGNRHEYFGVIRPGNEFRIVDRYLGVEEKAVKDKSYRLFLETGQRSYINQRDEVVVIATGRRIMTGTPPGRMNDTQNQLYQNIKRHHFTREELDAIHRNYDDELAGKNRRGQEVLYWEDVTVGEELKPLAKGPLDTSDAASAMLVEYGGAFAIKWNIMRGAIDSYPVDLATGEHRFRRDWHFEDSLAQLSGVPYAFQIGKYGEMILGHIVTNWMGDDGFVKVLDFQIRSINIMGNMNWLKGKVIKKYIDGDEPLVDLDIWAETQDGVIVTRGTATVRLISRAG
jgi:acyl dehydratase